MDTFTLTTILIGSVATSGALAISLPISSKKVGGLHFIRIGSLSISYCFTKKKVAN